MESVAVVEGITYLREYFGAVVQKIIKDGDQALESAVGRYYR